MFNKTIYTILVSLMLMLISVSLYACAKNALPNNIEDSVKSDIISPTIPPDISGYIGSFKYEDDGVVWYIDIKSDGTWEQANSFSESMDEGMWTYENNSIRLNGEVYNDVLTLKEERLVTSDDIYLVRAEMPVPGEATISDGYSTYIGNWYLSADIEPKMLLILESDYTFSLRSEKNEIANGAVNQAEDGFDLIINDTTVASIYAEDDDSLIMNIYENEHLTGLPQTCKFNRNNE